MKYNVMNYCCLLCALIFLGCSAARRDFPWPEARPLGLEIESYSVNITDADVQREKKINNPPSVIALDEALFLALNHNPDLRAAEREVHAGIARRIQAGLLPNPELEIGVGDFGGSAGRSGTDGASGEIVLSQLFEIGGKRSERIDVARLENRLKGWDYEAKRLDVITGTRLAFINVLSSQERLKFYKDSLDLSKKTFSAVAGRVRNGKESPVEETKARTEVSIAQIKFEQSKSELESARQDLVAYWGSEYAAISHAEGHLFNQGPIPVWDRVQPFVKSNPDLARWEDEIKLYTAQLKLEKSGSIPDLTLSVGVQGFREMQDNGSISNEHSFQAGLSMPLMIFDRNQGSILEAKRNLEKAFEERRSAELKIGNELAQVYRLLINAHSQSLALQNTVLPDAQEIFKATYEGYILGKFDYLLMLDAQKTLVEIQLQNIEAMTLFQSAKIQTERLTGQYLETLISDNK
jgi:outer membrane protein, heavy metal efflux system